MSSPALFQLIEKFNAHMPHISSKAPDQAWANYGPGAICSPLRFLIRPTELDILLNGVKVNVLFSL